MIEGMPYFINGNVDENNLNYLNKPVIDDHKFARTLEKRTLSTSTVSNYQYVWYSVLH